MGAAWQGADAVLLDDPLVLFSPCRYGHQGGERLGGSGLLLGAAGTGTNGLSSYWLLSTTALVMGANDTNALLPRQRRSSLPAQGRAEEGRRAATSTGSGGRPNRLPA